VKLKDLTRRSLRALGQLGQVLPGLQIKNFKENTTIKDTQIDLLFTGRLKGKQYRFVCEMKSLGSPSHILSSIAKLKEIAQSKKAYPVIFASYISQRSAEICRENEVGFIDLEGNAFLSFGDVLVDRRVKDRANIEKRKITVIFSPRATRVIRVLLENVEKRWLIGELAREAKLSLGYTSEVLRALVDQDYVNRQKRKGFQLENPAPLLDRWASEYDFSQNEIINLYPFEKDFSTLFRGIGDISRVLELKSGLTLLSGASVVAPYVARFSDVHVYVEGDIELWKENLDLREVQGGANIHLVTPHDEGVFYASRKVNGIPVIGNVQLYLDLFKYPARGKEQAEHLRSQLIGF